MKDQANPARRHSVAGLNRSHSPREVRPQPASTGLPDTWRVVVGVSDSPTGVAAVREAAHEAVQRGIPLFLLRVWRDVGWFPSMTRTDLAHMAEWEQADRELLENTANELRMAEPNVIVMTEWQAGDLYAALKDAGRGSALLVVGSGDEDPDSVADWLRRNVECPVLAVGSHADSKAGSYGSSR